MVGYYKHHIADWMDGTEALSDGAYRVYHVIVQLIMQNEGPIMRNERGIAGRCNQTIKTCSKHIDELLRAGKLVHEGGRLMNARADVELALIMKNRVNAGTGGAAPRNPEKTQGNFEKLSENSGKPPENPQNDPPKPLKNKDSSGAPLQGSGSLREKRREEQSSHASARTHEGPSAQDAALEAALRRASGLEGNPSPGLMVLGPIHALIGEGYDLDRHILPVLRDLANRHKTWSTWHYVVDRVREKNTLSPQARSIGAGLPAVAGRDPHAYVDGFTDDRWRDEVRRWKSTGGTWSLYRRTPAPDHPGTRVPPHILAEFGVGRDGTNITLLKGAA